MRLRVNHTTTYHFDMPMRGVVQSLRVQPTLFEGQQVISWQVMVDGAERGASFRDGAGDLIETATLLGPVSSFAITIAGEVETVNTGGVLLGLRELVPPESYLRWTRPTRADRALTELSESTTASIAADDVLARAHALCHAVRDTISYMPGETSAATTAAEAMAQGRGVCQDHAHALIAVARVAGIPARYVTGYLNASEGDSIGEASHAWAELWIPALGWVGFDPSNGICPDEHYIRLGSGIDAIEAAPIRGISQGHGAESLDVDVSVNQVQQ